MNLPYERARAYAEKIVDELGQYCTRIAIAGSIRRKRPICHDIDIVCMPSNRAALRARELQSAQVEQCCGEQVFRVTLKSGVQLDIYFAHPEERDMFKVVAPCNWGTLLLNRTGSKEFNIQLVLKAARLGYRWEPHRGVFNGAGDCLASATEEDVFKVLELDFVEPEGRG